MDITIQSLTQSSIVQKLSEQEHAVKRFVHDLEDNAPYRSHSKIETPPYSGDSNKPDSTLRFRVDRRGYLNRLYIKARLFFTEQPNETGALSNGTLPDAKPLGPEFFASWFTSASISIGGKIIETLYPENILFKAYQLKNPVAENVFRGLKGIMTDYSDVEAGEGSFDLNQDTGVDHPQYGNFMIPLDFSCMQFHKDALDTNFVAPIEIILRKRAVRAWQTITPAGAYTRCNLVCKYHNVHNHWRTQIRNTNFSKTTTSLITNDSYLLLDSGLYEAVAAVPQQVSPYIPGHDSFGRRTYKLDHLDFFATDILITFRKNDATNLDDFFGDVVRVPGPTGFVRFKLIANNRVIFEKNHWEMMRQHVNKSNLVIQDANEFAYGTKLLGQEREDDIGWAVDSIDLPPIMQTNNNNGFSFAASLYRIPLSLFSSDEFQSGGLYLNSLTNVRLVIEGQPLILPGSTNDHRGMTPQVVVKHKKITRVDTKTGTFSV
jgi:hypothetical protein